jgi:hypothetical protein
LFIVQLGTSFDMKYWIGVASRDHVRKGMMEGFCQVCHGKKGPLSKMKEGDWIIYYSPVKTMVTMENRELLKPKENKLQAFTAIGQLKDNNCYQFQMAPNFVPFRRDVSFSQEINEVSFQDIKDRLEFVTQNKNYPFLFRRGIFEISQHDFTLIHDRMLNT